MSEESPRFGENEMRMSYGLSAAAIILLIGQTLPGGETQDRALDALRKVGAIIERDRQRPGNPVIAIDLSFSDVRDKDLEALKAFPDLRILNLRECWGTTEKGLQCLAGLTQLRELDLQKTGVSDEGLKHLEKLTNLQSLSFYWDLGITDKGLRHLQGLTALRHLDLSSCSEVTGAGLTHLSNLRNLHYLNLSDTKISDDDLIHLQKFRNLNTLILHYTKISDKGLARLEGLNRLQTLDLSSTDVTDKGLKHLKGLREIRCLNLGGVHIMGEGVEQLQGLSKLRSLRLGWNFQGAYLPSLKSLKQLRKLSLAAARFEPEDWNYLGQFTSLESLEIGLSRLTTDKGLSYLRQLTNLQHLELQRIEHMTDKGLEPIKGLAKLRSLRLRMLAIGDSGVRKLGGLTELRALELDSLKGTDAGLKILKHLHHLQTLKLTDMAVTDETLKNLGHLKPLRELDLASTSISDAGLIHLQELSDLQELSLSGTHVTNRGLGHLKPLKSLKRILVEYTDVTDAGVMSFRQARPETKVIQYTIHQSGYRPTLEQEKSIASRRLVPLVRILIETDDVNMQLDVLRGMHEALQGRRTVTTPEGWAAVHRKLAKSRNAEIREKVLQLSVMFGDPQALAALRKTAGNPKVDAKARQRALQALIEKRPADLPPLLRKLLGDRTVRGLALRGLASYSDPETPTLVLDLYASLSEAEKADAIATLASRPAYGFALLDAMEKGRVPRRDLSAFNARQISSFNDKKLTARLTKVWGSIRPPAKDKAKLLAKYKAMVPADALKNADRKHGRLLFSRTCATCHTLFGEGGKIGPDLTGSQRTNPEYLLTKLLDPSAVVARDYQMTLITTKTGRVLSGLIKEETDKTLALQTQNEVVRLPKSDIDERQKSQQSMMPDGLLAPLSAAEVRDLIAYLSGNGQAPLPTTPRK